MPRTSKLTEIQKRFVDEYLVDLNATQAYIRAGYKGGVKTASVNGNKLLVKACVAAYVSERQAALRKRSEKTLDDVVRELEKIGFADIRKVVQWGHGIATLNETTGEVEIGNGVSLIGSDMIDDDTAAAISEVSTYGGGLKVKLHDKRAALVDLGRHLGGFTERREITGKDGGPVQQEVKQRASFLLMDPIEAARAYQELMDME